MSPIILKKYADAFVLAFCFVIALRLASGYLPNSHTLLSAFGAGLVSMYNLSRPSPNQIPPQAQSDMADKEAYWAKYADAESHADAWREAQEAEKK